MPDPLSNFIGQTTQVLTQGTVTALSFPLRSGSTTDVIRPRSARISVEGNAVRWGPSPSATNGQYVAVGGVIDWSRPDFDFTAQLQQVRFVSGSGPAVLQCVFYD